MPFKLSKYFNQAKIYSTMSMRMEELSVESSKYVTFEFLFP